MQHNPKHIFSEVNLTELNGIYSSGSAFLDYCLENTFD